MIRFSCKSKRKRKRNNILSEKMTNKDCSVKTIGWISLKSSNKMNLFFFGRIHLTKSFDGESKFVLSNVFTELDVINNIINESPLLKNEFFNFVDEPSKKEITCPTFYFLFNYLKNNEFDLVLGKDHISNSLLLKSVKITDDKLDFSISSQGAIVIKKLLFHFDIKKMEYVTIKKTINTYTITPEISEE